MLSPSLHVILSAAKNLLPLRASSAKHLCWLRVNSAKNLSKAQTLRFAQGDNRFAQGDNRQTVILNPSLHVIRDAARLGPAERGQTLVEFCLVLVLFLVLIFAIIDFGLGLNANIQTANAAREGARKGAVGYSGAGLPAMDCNPLPDLGTAAIQKRVCDTAGSLARSNISSITVTTIEENGVSGIGAGDSVKVEVSCSYDFITPVSPLVALMSGGSLNASLPCNATAVMRLE